MNLRRIRNRIKRAIASPLLTLRRWQAAKTDRLNSAHWAEANATHINSDLSCDLPTLRQRCLHEIENNAMLEGIVDTFVTDLVGEDGPALEVVCDDNGFADRLEAAWAEWWALPDVNEQFSGVELLDLAARQLWTQGAFIWQLLTAGKTAQYGIRLRINEIHPRRLQTPFATTLASVTLGVERTPTGKPLRYHFSDLLPGNVSAIGPMPTVTRAIQAENIIHGFKRVEAGQADGYPWLAPALQVAADIRDYDAEVMDAARAAADYMILLTATGDDAPFFDIDDTSVEFQRRQIRTMPPGWEAHQMRAEQPQTNYVDYRIERQHELGRVAGMPINMIRLDSSRHNFASARFDAKPYERKLRKTGGWFCRTALNPLVEKIETEARLRGRRPEGGYTLVWTWPIPRFAGDPAREARADDVRLKNLTSTLREIVQANGKPFDLHVAQLKREVQQLAEAGVLHPGIVEQTDQAAAASRNGDVEAVEDFVRGLIDEILTERNQHAFAIGAN